MVLAIEALGKSSDNSPVTLEQIAKEIEYCNMKIRDNCNVESQLKIENKALRFTVNLLKQKRHELIFQSVEG